MKIRVVILGAGDHGRVVFDILESEKRNFRVVGFIDILGNEEIWGTTIASKPIFGGPDKLDALVKKGISDAFVAYGDNAIRRKHFEDLEMRGFHIVPVKHPGAHVSRNAYVGKGACINAGAAIVIGSRLGRGVIVNTGATIDHDCMIGDFVHVGPGAHLAGNITVGDETFIGAGAIIAHPRGKALTIGKKVIIAAGAVVMKNIPDGKTVKGNPGVISRAQAQGTGTKTKAATKKKKS